jgi:hypothetical protein
MILRIHLTVPLGRDENRDGVTHVKSLKVRGKLSMREVAKGCRYEHLVVDRGSRRNGLSLISRARNNVRIWSLRRRNPTLRLSLLLGRATTTLIECGGRNGVCWEWVIGLLP